MTCAPMHEDSVSLHIVAHEPRPSLSSRREVVGPALLLWPQFRVVRLGVVLELDLVGVDDLLAAVGALSTGYSPYV